MPLKLQADILNGFPDPAFLLDDQRRIVAANDKARAALGEAGVGTGRDLVHAVRRPEVLAAVDAVLGGRRLAETTATLEGGLSGLFNVTAARVGEVGAVVSFADISHIREAEQMRSDFVANVSHELRSPLTALTGFIETLTGPAKGDPDAQVRFLDLMAREAARMNRLIGDLLTLSRVEVDARVRPTDPVDLKLVIEGVIDTLSHMAEKDDVKIELTGAGARCMVRGDADQLTQVMQNLIENAVKYGGPDQTVHVTLSCIAAAAGMPGPACVIEVRDEGPGVPRAHIPRLTERFYRVDAGRSRDKGGTGLGLAIVKHIVGRHRGRLHIDNAAGGGALVRVTLPAAD